MDNLTISREWRRLAEMDLMSAEYLLKMHPVPIEIICHHCQQSAEKYLKGYLVLHGSNISNSFVDIVDQCSDLTAYGVQPRYPMQLLLEDRDMQEALIDAKAIRDFVINLAPGMAQE